MASESLVSRRLAGPGEISNFASRSQGALCPNNLYIAALVVPILAVTPALFMNFSPVLLAIFLLLAGLLAFRFFVIFPKIACGHCRAQNICPQARQMGLGKDQGE